MPSESVRLAQVPHRYQADYKNRKRSRKAAVNAMCRECTGWDRKAVRECSDTACPLWHWRPYKAESEE